MTALEAANMAKNDVEEHQVQITPTREDGLRESGAEKQVDTIHGDEATTVLANYSGPQDWTPEVEKKLLRKIDRKLLAILVLTCGLQYYDKAMLSHAVSEPSGGFDGY